MKSDNATFKYSDLTIEDVRACKAFKDISEAEAQQIIDTIKPYTEIICSCYLQGRLTKQSNTPVRPINISPPGNNKAA